MRYLGIDTSNYTTSAAIYDSDSETVVQKKMLLPVKAGERGLRQSDAVFHHTVQLPQIMESLFAESKGTVDGVGVSVFPRREAGSYTGGNILLGGKQLSAYTAKSVRKSAGIVMQDNFIFSDSVRRNIVLGEEEDDRRLAEAIETACLTEYVNERPLGAETKVGAEGIGLSGGERQRMMIARAVYKRPQYLMLDEATSSLDTENERRITENLDRCFQGRTRIVIAHRLSTVKDADNIIVLKHGEEIGRASYRERVLFWVVGG